MSIMLIMSCYTVKLKYFTRGICLYQHCIRETSDIRKKYLPIFLNIFIVTGNQMFITIFLSRKKCMKRHHLRPFGFFLGYLMHLYIILNIKGILSTSCVIFSYPKLLSISVLTFIKWTLNTKLLMNTLRNVVFSTKEADHRYRKLINYALTWARPTLFIYLFFCQ